MQRFLTKFIALSFLLSVIAFESTFVMAQEFAPPPDMGDGSMPGGGQAAAVSVPSDTKESDSAIRALLYKDLVSVTRFDTRRVNFPGLKKYSSDFINGAIGSVVDEDKYLVKLRDTQKEKIVDGLESYLNRVQNDFKILNQAGVGEYFRLYYEDGTAFCLAYAYPVKTPVAAQTIIKLVSRDNPITCFERFGFLIVVLDQSTEVAVDASATAKKKDDEEDEEEEKVDPILEKRKLTLPPIRKRFMKPAVEDAKTGKYLNNATEALLYSEGAAISMVFPTTEKFAAAIDFCKTNGLEFTDTELKAGLEKNKKAFQWATFNVSLAGDNPPSEAPVAAPVAPQSDMPMDPMNPGTSAAAKKPAPPADPASPKIVLYLKYANPAGANDFSKAFNECVSEMRTSINKLVDTQIKDMKLPFVSNPFDPMLGILFNQLKPVVKGGELVVVFNCETLLENANIFVPIFGGVPIKGSLKKKGKFDEEEEISFDDEPSEDDAKKKDNKKTDAKKADTKKADAAPEKKPAASPSPAPEKKSEGDKKPEPKKADDDPFAE